jgi:DNA (cytosine-5)-methyltransferase 1
MTDTAHDLFAGPGGWDVAARDLGIDVTGVELDHDACETRRAAGLATIEDSVTDHGPADLGRAEGLIGSPPCQTFSIAGSGSGRLALARVLDGVKALEAGEAPLMAAHDDPRTALVLEPLEPGRRPLCTVCGSGRDAHLIPTPRAAVDTLVAKLEER